MFKMVYILLLFFPLANAQQFQDVVAANTDKELEADFFAGRTLSILGASLEETLSVTSILPERASSTHPARINRANKAKEGWNSTKNKNTPIVDNKNTNHLPIIDK